MSFSLISLSSNLLSFLILSLFDCFTFVHFDLGLFFNLAQFWIQRFGLLSTGNCSSVCFSALIIVLSPHLRFLSWKIFVLFLFHCMALDLEGCSVSVTISAHFCSRSLTTRPEITFYSLFWHKYNSCDLAIMVWTST